MDEGGTIGKAPVALATAPIGKEAASQRAFLFSLRRLKGAVVRGLRALSSIDTPATTFTPEEPRVLSIKYAIFAVRSRRGFAKAPRTRAFSSSPQWRRSGASCGPRLHSTHFASKHSSGLMHRSVVV